MTTLLKVYVNGGLFDKSRSLLSELEALGYADDEVNITSSSVNMVNCILICG